MGIVGHIDLAAELALRLAGAGDAEVDHVITAALEQLAAAAAVDRAYVTRYHPDGTFENSHEWTADGIVPQRPAIQRLRTDAFPYSHGLALAEEVLRVARLADLPPEASSERESFGSFGVQSLLQVPIFVDSELLGVIGLNNLRSMCDWDDSTCQRVSLVGRAIGVALSRRAANERVRLALEAAQRANSARDDLISRASHELRTPLHAVVGFAEILELDGVRHEALDQIRENGKLLLTMIDDLLELGRLADEPSLQEKAAIEELIAGVLGGLEAVATNRRVLVAFTKPGGPSPMTAAATRVRQVLHCVASAALVAAGDGGSVEASLDAGPGAGTVMEFACSGPHSTRPAGLALALARSLAESLDGWVSNDEVDGVSVIRVQLGQPANP